MANLNLSQFTEKTLVADADWVFVWDTAGAISKKVSRNSLLNSGTLAGASAPITVSQTWNDAAVAFTALKVNAVSTASASGSLLLDLQVGGVSQFSVDKSGNLLGTNYTIGVPTILTQSNISITNTHSGVADSAVVITPKGLGAFILGPKPDGTVTGGNARGFYAVDLQIYRSGNTSVASGNFSSLLGGVNNRASAQYSFVGGGTANIGSGSHSTVLGGEANTASSNYSVVVGGSLNTASGLSSFIGGGNNGLADRYCLSAQASGRFAANGDAQKTTAVFRNKTTTNSAVELFLDGASARYTITSGKVISMLINITGTKSDGTAVAHYVRQYSIKNVGGTSQVYAAVTVGTDYNPSGTSIALSADATNNSLKIEVTGVTSETWRWVASVDAVEVGYGV